MIEPTPIITSQEEQKCRQILSGNNNASIGDAVGKINDDYLYWSDVKYRAQAVGLTPKELWALVKYARAQTDITVAGFTNMHFGLTNRMWRQCHEFDVSLIGSWTAVEDFPDNKTTRELCLASSIMEEAIASSQMEGAVTHARSPRICSESE